MSSPIQSNGIAGVVNPPNLPTNPDNIYLTYITAAQAALVISRTNPSIYYYLIEIAPISGIGGYKITTAPDETSAHAFVAGEMIPL